MDELNTPEGIQNKIEKIFFGDVPAHFTILLDAKYFDAFMEVFSKQNAKSAYAVNYVQFIQDIGEFWSPRIKELLQNDQFSIDADQFRRDYKTLVTAIYLELYQDEKIPRLAKLEMGFFYKSFFETFKAIYDIELLEKQQEFIALIDKNDNELNALTEAEEFIDAMLENAREKIRQVRLQILESKADEVLFFWKHGQDKLKVLEDKLKSIPLVGLDSTLVPLFCARPITQIRKVDWTGKQGALIYLFYKITEKTMIIEHYSVYKFIENRFTINGEGITTKQLSSSWSNIVKRYISIGALKPEFLLQIDNILASLGI